MTPDADRAREVVEALSRHAFYPKGSLNWAQAEKEITQALTAVRAEARREEREKILRLAKKWSGQCVVEAPGNVPSCFDGLIEAIQGQE